MRVIGAQHIQQLSYFFSCYLHPELAASRSLFPAFFVVVVDVLDSWATILPARVETLLGAPAYGSWMVE